MTHHPRNPADGSPALAAVTASRVRACDALPPSDSTGQTELARLGALVRTLRTGRGLSARDLARRAVVARSTVQRLEHGTLRPRKSLLLMVANAIDPDECKEILGQLVTAAGSAMATDTPGWERRRRRQMELGWMSGEVPLPAAIDRSIRLHRQADEAWRRAMELTDQYFATGDHALMEESSRLLKLSRRLSDEAGAPVTLIAGGRRIVFGLGVS